MQEVEVWDCFLLKRLSAAVVPFSLPDPCLLPPPLPDLLPARPLPPPLRLPPLRPPRPHARPRPRPRTVDVCLNGRPSNQQPDLQMPKVTLLICQFQFFQKSTYFKKSVKIVILPGPHVSINRK